MATTTAAITLNSDLLSDTISISASSTLMKADTTSDGLTMVDYGVILKVYYYDAFKVLPW